MDCGRSNGRALQLHDFILLNLYFTKYMLVIYKGQKIKIMIIIIEGYNYY